MSTNKGPRPEQVFIFHLTGKFKHRQKILEVKIKKLEFHKSVHYEECNACLVTLQLELACRGTSEDRQPKSQELISSYSAKQNKNFEKKKDIDISCIVKLLKQVFSLKAFMCITICCYCSFIYLFLNINCSH